MKPTDPENSLNDFLYCSTIFVMTTVFDPLAFLKTVLITKNCTIITVPCKFLFDYIYVYK